jgi:hypothetical protein
MISELNDEEILDFLMTNDFDGDYKPEELKYLLLKWRYFYRILSGRIEVFKSDTTLDLQKLEDEILKLKTQIEELQKDIASKENDMLKFSSRKLTLKERIKGKINIGK